MKNYICKYACINIFTKRVKILNTVQLIVLFKIANVKLNNASIHRFHTLFKIKFGFILVINLLVRFYHSCACCINNSKTNINVVLPDIVLNSIT